MRKACLLVCVVLFFPVSGFADVAAIRAAELPQEPAVLAALDDIKQIEPYCQFWVAEKLWYFNVPRKTVANRLSKDLDILTGAVNAHSDNLELALLTAIAANYAHNLEVHDSYRTSVTILDAAGKLAPGDIRIGWLRSTLHCQSTEIEEGTRGFLALESASPPDQQPPGFWDDYMECTLLSNLPAHVLRAAGYLDKAHAQQSDRGRAYVKFAHERLIPFDPQRDYEPSAVFLGYDDGSDEVMTGASFGVKIRVHSNWEKSGFKLKGDKGTTLFLSGPYTANKGTLKPSILLLVQQAKPGQTLEEFSKSFERDVKFVPFALPRCPADKCIAELGVLPGAYHENGDGRPRVVFFEREQPEFPGILFESPSDLPYKEGKTGPESFRFAPIQQRMPGRLFYVVLLDTASSIEEPAVKDFDFFLKNLVVE